MKLAPPRPEGAAAPDTLASRRTSSGQASVAHRRGGPPRRRVVVLLKTLAIISGLIGILALTDAVLTVVWQEPISGLLAHFQQTRLAQNLKRLEGQRATPADERALAALPSDNERIAFFAHRLQQTAAGGQAVGRIRIPRIGADFVVVAGTDESSLQKGPGIYSGTAVPGLRGTVGIAGHRTTYLAPFRRINELGRGDRITVEMPYGLFSYTVLRHQIVSPNDVGVLQRASSDQVVLTACNPLYSAAQRIVVFARLTAAAPAGPALVLTSPTPSPPQPLLPAQIAGALLGAASQSEPGPNGGAPSVDAAGVVLGDGGQRAVTPVRVRPLPGRARAGVRRPSGGRRAATGPTAALRIGPPAVTRRRPGTVPTNVAPLRSAPAPVRAPVQAPVRRPTPLPAHRPAVKRPVSSPPAATKPKVAQPQTRVQGSPGGPSPIIEVPSPPR